MEERYQTTLRNVLDGWDTNDFAEIVMKNGKAMLDLSITWTCKLLKSGMGGLRSLRTTPPLF